jgi:hypothetical protein
LETFKLNEGGPFMRHHIGSWETSYHVISVYKDDQWVLLERVPVKKTKPPKQVSIPDTRFLNVAVAASAAAASPPHGALSGPLPVAMVEAGHKPVTISWEPYEWGTTNALIIRKESGHSIAVVQTEAPRFALWLLRQAYQLEADRIDAYLAASGRSSR